MRFRTKMLASLILAGLATTGFAQTYNTQSQYPYHHHKKTHYAKHHCPAPHKVYHHTYHKPYHHHYVSSSYNNYPHHETAMYKDMAPIPVYIPRFNGFYIGASVGADSSTFSYHDSAAHRINQGEVSGLAGIFAGYGRLVARDFYLGGEIYLNDTAGDATAHNTLLDNGGTHVGIQTRARGGISILPGILLTDDSLGYLRIGAVGTQYYTQVNNGLVRATNNNRKAGFELGLGVRTSLTKNVNVRIEYSHAAYRSYYTKVNGYHMKPMGDVANVGIVYQFG